MAAGIAVRNQHRVFSIGGEPAVGLVDDFRLGHNAAVLQAKVRYRKTPILDGSQIYGHRHGPP